MTDPTLKRTRVLIAYTGSDGYRSEWQAKGGVGSKAPAEGPLLAGIEELARMLALFGFEDEARKRVDGAFARVREWRETRHANAPKQEAA